MRYAFNATQVRLAWWLQQPHLWLNHNWWAEINDHWFDMEDNLYKRWSWTWEDCWPNLRWLLKRRPHYLGDVIWQTVGAIGVAVVISCLAIVVGLFLSLESIVKLMLWLILGACILPYSILVDVRFDNPPRSSS
jgi:hypothetical protein